MPRNKVKTPKEILYVTAFNKSGILVKAKDADKKEDYFCPECKDKLTLKKSGKTGKGSKRPQPEGVLHKSFKLLLLEKIKKQIADKTPINFEWECLFCHTKHNGNLLFYAADVKEEYQFENCRADLALLDRANNPFAVIEIVVTHKPEEAVIEFYKTNKIVLIQIELESDDVLDKIDAKINIPTSVNYCFNHQCSNRNEYKFNRNLRLKRDRCGNLHLLLSCDIETLHYFGLHHSLDYTEEEIKIAQSKGVSFGGNKVICPYCVAMLNRYRRPRRF